MKTCNNYVYFKHHKIFLPTISYQEEKYGKYFMLCLFLLIICSRRNLWKRCHWSHYETCYKKWPYNLIIIRRRYFLPNVWRTKKSRNYTFLFDESIFWKEISMGVSLFMLIICLTHIKKIITTKNGLRILDKKYMLKRESYIPENWLRTQNTYIMNNKSFGYYVLT